MHKACVKAVEWLGIAGAQAKTLCTMSTGFGFLKSRPGSFYTAHNTGFAQFLGSFTQGLSATFYLLTPKLYPFSTLPTITTNLIKE